MLLQNKLDNILVKTKQSVRNERIALELTQKEFADFVGIKYATYLSFEQEGKLSFENFIKILLGLHKEVEYEKFLDGFEFENQKERFRKEQKTKHSDFFKPIVPPSQKQITLDKQIFGEELFYSVENGHIYEVSTLITIILKSFNDERLLLLIRYFGIERLKPYVLKEKNIELLKKFNKHITYIQSRNKDA